MQSTPSETGSFVEGANRVPAVVTTVEEALPYVLKAVGALGQGAQTPNISVGYRKVKVFMERRNREALASLGRREYPIISGVLIGKCLKVAEERGLLHAESGLRINGGKRYGYVKAEPPKEGYFAELDVERVRNPPVLRIDMGDILGLMRSIKEKGLLQPITVRPVKLGDDGSPAEYEVVTGFRRFTALRNLGYKKVNAYVRPDLYGRDKEALEFAILENLQRKDLSPIEEMHFFLAYTGGFGSPQELAEKTGLTPSYVESRIMLRYLPYSLKQLVHERKMGVVLANNIVAQLRSTGLPPDRYGEIVDKALREGVEPPELPQYIASGRWSGQPDAEADTETSTEANTEHHTVTHTESKQGAPAWGTEEPGLHSTGTTTPVYAAAAEAVDVIRAAQPTQYTLDHWLPYARGEEFSCWRCGEHYRVDYAAQKILRRV